MAKEDEVQHDTTGKTWVDGIISSAIQSRASDIHLEPESTGFNIRYRVDGLLYQVKTLAARYHEPILSRLKVLARLDISESRIPQDGHFEFTHNNRIYNIRTSTYPTTLGEVAVLRILNREESHLNLTNLGFDGDQLKKVEALIAQPYGLILITGPSGSGKTTLLYSILSVLNKPNNNIITIEDPVEYQIKGMRQAQVEHSGVFDFAIAMRSVLRQDPDIVMVGEIRDTETVQIAMQAALTGRLVFSTFHTLDVVAVVTRLIELQVPRSVVAHVITGIVSARLMRKICPHCRMEDNVSEDDKRLLGRNIDPGQKFYKGKGCEQCTHSGYYGQTGIFEVVTFDEEIRQIIIDKKPLINIVPILEKKSVKKLSHSAVDRVLEGKSSIKEMIRIIGKPL